jgi:hypothetical protein
MFAEEAFLRVKFGQAYLDWSVDVPSFWPRNLKWVAPDVEFSLRNVLKREYNGFFAVFLSLAMVSAGKTYVHITQDWESVLHPFWQSAVISSFAVFFILRSLKRYSRVLHVEGR